MMLEAKEYFRDMLERKLNVYTFIKITIALFGKER